MQFCLDRALGKWQAASWTFPQHSCALLQQLGAGFSLLFRNILLRLWATLRSWCCQRCTVPFLVRGWSRKENKYVRKRGTTLKIDLFIYIFLRVCTFFFFLIKQKRINKKFMV